MADPMSAERLAEIRRLADAVIDGFGNEWAIKQDQDYGEVTAFVPQGLGEFEMFVTGQADYADGAVWKFLAGAVKDVPALLAEVDRLRASAHGLGRDYRQAVAERDAERAVVREGTANMRAQLATVRAERDEARTLAGVRGDLLAAYCLPGSLAPGETPALCPDCTQALCVPGLPGCATCVAERLESAETGERTADSQVEALHAELNETRRAAHRDRLAADGAVGRIERLAAERDQAERDVDRLTGELDEQREIRWRIGEHQVALRRALGLSAERPWADIIEAAQRWRERAEQAEAERDRARAELEKSRNGGKELGKSVVFLAELIKSAFQRGADDPIGALHMLGDHLAHLFEDEGGLPVDEHNRVYAALNERQAEQARAAEAAAGSVRQEVTDLVKKASER